MTRTTTFLFLLAALVGCETAPSGELDPHDVSAVEVAQYPSVIGANPTWTTWTTWDGATLDQQFMAAAVGRLNVPGAGRCSCSLISPNLFLTAGHCVDNTAWAASSTRSRPTMS